MIWCGLRLGATLCHPHECLIWDFTCADTLCKSYVKKASKEVGSAIAGREDKKVDKYSNLSDMYHFVPLHIETYGASRPQASQADQEKNPGRYW